MSKLKTPVPGTENPAVTPPAPDLNALRTRRIHDYLAASLRNADPLLANLGAVHSDLLQLQQRLKKAMDNALASGEAELSDLEFLLPVLDHLLRLTKQIDRFSQLELQLKSAARKSSPPQRQSARRRNTPAMSAEDSPASEE